MVVIVLLLIISMNGQITLSAKTLPPQNSPRAAALPLAVALAVPKVMQMIVVRRLLVLLVHFKLLLILFIILIHFHLVHLIVLGFPRVIVLIMMVNSICVVCLIRYMFVTLFMMVMRVI